MQAGHIPLKDLQEYHDIPYLPSPNGAYHLFDLYVPKIVKDSQSREEEIVRARPPLICFVHGGAWRAEDKSQHALLARRLASLTSWAVAVPNYRLTTPSSQLKHPGHAEDTLAFLNFAIDWQGPSETPGLYDPSHLYLIGHSCSAHMLASIFLSPTPTHDPAPSLRPSPRLTSSVRGFIFSEGIYDLDLLLASFPGYKEWFIANTFGERSSYAAWNTMNMPLGEEMRRAKARWLLLHSSGDKLVDMKQSEGMFEHLKREGVDVEVNTDLTADHNDTLKEEDYARIISSFMTARSG